MTRTWRLAILAATAIVSAAAHGQEHAAAAKPDVAKAQQIVNQVCAACHGADGKGSTQIGAPNLTDAIWLYGSTEAAIVESVTKGRGEATVVTRMPAHKDLLGAGKLDLLVAYVWGLSNAR